ncbi:hypothetical protein NR798_35255 [Archangium gephyra]|uniref:hypothetical protein n=1 Tax=Archangium gephyra TaxID=48 RepID=UPI0035D4969F
MKDNTPKKEVITQKEPSVSFEILELDDAVLDSAVGGFDGGVNPVNGCAHTTYKMN